MPSCSQRGCQNVVLDLQQLADNNSFRRNTCYSDSRKFKLWVILVTLYSADKIIMPNCSQKTNSLHHKCSCSTLEQALNFYSLRKKKMGKYIYLCCQNQSPVFQKDQEVKSSREFAGSCLFWEFYICNSKYLIQ